MLEKFLKTCEVASVLRLKGDKHHDDNIWAIADSLQPDALSTRWTVLSERVEAGGFFTLGWTRAKRLDRVSSWWSAVGDCRVASAFGTEHRSPLGINETTCADGCNVKQICETTFGKVAVLVLLWIGTSELHSTYLCGTAKKISVYSLVCIASSDKL